MTRILILGAGYGTRLESDVQSYIKTHSSSENSENEFQLVQSLSGVSKALLPLAGKPLTTHWVDQILRENICSLEDIFVVTNDAHYKQFLEWASKCQIPQSNIYNNGTTSNETRNGAILDMKIMLEYMTKCGKYHDDEALIVIGGDTLFDRQFQLCTVQNCAKHWDILLLCYQLSESEHISEKGIIEIKPIAMETNSNQDEHHHDEYHDNQLSNIQPKNMFQVTKFWEKPKEGQTDSRTASPCFYAISRNAQKYINEYLSVIEKDEQYNRLKDAPGYFVKYMVENVRVGALPVHERFDVGRLDQYFETNAYFLQ